MSRPPCGSSDRSVSLRVTRATSGAPVGN
jgi:hypothetical protein